MGCGAIKSKAKYDPAAAPLIRGSLKENEPLTGHAACVLDNAGAIADVYEMSKAKVGEGSYGSVVLATNKACKSVRACKIMPKSVVKRDMARFQQEVRVMKMMDHPNIIKLFETFEDHRNIYLVMELCTGGELFDRIINEGAFTEVKAAMVMQQILRAISYMHECHVTHRDLKPENFLLTTKDPIEGNTVKIIDFGLACVYGPKTVLTTKAGTPYYVAPQVLMGKYDHTADIWSCGVIMYVLLCGYPPFDGDSDAEVLSKVKLGKFCFEGNDWAVISQDAKDLITRMLTMCPQERCSAKGALQHVWVASKAPRAKDMPLDSGIVKNLRAFRGQNKFKKAALQIIASQMSEEQIRQLRDVFVSLDDNGDGTLTAAELQEGLAKAGLDAIPAELQQLMDGSNNGAIDYTEFLAATLDKKLYIQEDVLWQAFRVFDRNGDGSISRDEIAAVLGDSSVQGAANRDVAQLMQDFDANGDGQIDFQEFVHMMRSGA